MLPWTVGRPAMRQTCCRWTSAWLQLLPATSTFKRTWLPSLGKITSAPRDLWYKCNPESHLDRDNVCKCNVLNHLYQGGRLGGAGTRVRVEHGGLIHVQSHQQGASNGHTERIL